MIDLHFTCGCILFLASVVGCLLPFQKRFDVTPIRPLSTGIIFGVALCHLLPDAGEILDTTAVTNWFMDVTRLEGATSDEGLYEVVPVAETLMCLGIFIMLVIDQCIPCPHHQVQSASHSLTKGETIPLIPSATTCSNHNNNSGTKHHHHHHHDHNQAAKIPNAKVYATEVAIAIHSIIIGFTMGINPNTDALIGFTIAMIFHQMFEGIALAMIARQGNLDFNALVFMILMFASSLPIGIAIGLFMYNLAVAGGDSGGDQDQLDAGTIFFQGVPNAIAAGMLLHIGFELMMEDFNHSSNKFPMTKLILAFLGGSLICFLAVWA